MVDGDPVVWEHGVWPHVVGHVLERGHLDTVVPQSLQGAVKLLHGSLSPVNFGAVSIFILIRIVWRLSEMALSNIKPDSDW